MRSVDEQIMHIWNLIRSSPENFQEKRFLIMGETTMLHFNENIVDEELEYTTAVQRVSCTRGSIFDVMTKLEFILDELFLAKVVGFFER